MTVASSIRRTVRHPASRRLGWIVGLSALAAAGIGGAVYYSEKSAKAAPSPKPTPGPNNTPVWTQLTPVPSGSGMYGVQVPANATFAFADNELDPNLPSIAAGLNAAVNAGTVGSPNAYPQGSAPPAGWPSDGFGTSGYRATGVANQAFTLSLGPLTKNVPGNPPSVWIISSFTSA